PAVSRESAGFRLRRGLHRQTGQRARGAPPHHYRAAMSAQCPDSPLPLPPGLEHINQALLQSVCAGSAIVDPGSLEILFLYERLVEYLPAACPGACLGDMLTVAGLDGVPPGGRVQGEVAVKVKRRPVTLAVNASHHEHDGRAFLLVECQNISRVRE